MEIRDSYKLRLAVGNIWVLKNISGEMKFAAVVLSIFIFLLLSPLNPSHSQFLVLPRLSSPLQWTLTGSMEWRRTRFAWLLVTSSTSYGPQTTSKILYCVIYKFLKNNYSVAPVSAEDYLACLTADTEPVDGPLAWTAPAEEGMVYVICGVRTHCADGNQKLAITVSNSC